MNEREQQLSQNLQAIEDRVQRAACPIYGLDDRDRPYLIGSSVLVTVSPHLFLLTAAHVLDQNKHTTLYLAGREQSVELVGPSHRVATPPSGRPQDRLDFGFILLPNAIKQELGRFTILTAQDIDVDDLPAEHTLYGFVGYPETKNKPLPGRRFKLSSVVFTVIAASLDRYSPLGLNPLVHFVADFDRRKLLDPEKRIITGPMPRGMSGGGVWRLGRPDEILSGSRCERLIGVGIEHRKSSRVLVGVRMSLVVNSLASCYPEVSTLLPRPTRVRVNVGTRQAL